MRSEGRLECRVTAQDLLLPSGHRVCGRLGERVRWHREHLVHHGLEEAQGQGLIVGVERRRVVGLAEVLRRRVVRRRRVLLASLLLLLREP